MCGRRTSGHRQYCPNCRPWRGREKPLVDDSTRGLIINAVPFGFLFFGYYLIKKGQITAGIWSIVLGAILIYFMLFTKKGRDKFMEREMR
jgi:hypothetical protein